MSFFAFIYLCTVLFGFIYGFRRGFRIIVDDVASTRYAFQFDDLGVALVLGLVGAVIGAILGPLSIIVAILDRRISKKKLTLDDIARKIAGESPAAKAARKEREQNDTES